MPKRNLTLLVLFLSATTSCGEFSSDQKFKADEKSSLTPPMQPDSQDQIADLNKERPSSESFGDGTIPDKPDEFVVQEVANPGKEVFDEFISGDSSQNICYTDGPQDFAISSNTIHSSTSHGGGVHAWLSETLEFHLSNLKGNVLPLNNFIQDDVVMLVPADTTVENLVTYSAGSKIINVPEGAILVYTAGLSSYANGKIDDNATIVYRFESTEQVILPGGDSKPLSSVYDLAPKLTASDDVRLSKLNKDVFLVGDYEKIAFKVALIPHGIGFVGFNISIPGCDSGL